MKAFHDYHITFCHLWGNPKSRGEKKVSSIICLINCHLSWEYCSLCANWNTKLGWHKHASLLPQENQTYPLSNKHSKVHLICIKSINRRGISNACWAGLSRFFVPQFFTDVIQRWLSSAVNTSAVLLLFPSRKEDKTQIPLFSLFSVLLWQS